MKVVITNMNNAPKYIKENSQDYFANPDKYKAKEQMYKDMGIDSECMPVGIYDGFISQKGESNIMEKTQYNIRDRFGFLSEDDNESATNEASEY